MKRGDFGIGIQLLGLAILLAGCGGSKADPKAEAPPAPIVEHEPDPNVFQVDHPEQFPLATAVEHSSASQLVATGAISPDISRSVPVISLATGRVVEVHARLGDTRSEEHTSELQSHLNLVC